MSVGHGSTASVSVGGSSGVSADVNVGGGEGVSADVSVGSGSGGVGVDVGGGTGDGGTDIADGGSGGTGDGGSGTGVGTDVAGVDPEVILPEIDGDTISIVGSSVWTKDAVLVGMVTAIESQSGEQVVVRVSPVDSFGAPYNTLRFQAAMRAFSNHQLMLQHDQVELLDHLS
ncbi:hypothetical protein DS901_05835 [Loktanella sp. D2R18]|nr:hypothetical protein DS901_05835 [Loktanella sp. D2R18]